MADNKKWYALYTKPRWEKKVHRILSERGMESYCPLNKVKKKWSDRVKLVEEPLFKSYVFVHVSDEERPNVRPAEVRDKEINDIKRFMNEYEEVMAYPMQLKPDSKVIIRSGLMMDTEATVQRVLNNRVEVVIESLGYRLVAFVEKANLVPIS
jgi:transcription antitermination factor NusG